ncbi:MAG: NTP transferase domain-containing protein [Candidatus Sumerlaeaceae bacterium]|nr:NTP transferase domain-containing protein [Candidatus Sumerlaeaceae bacterium]
MPRALIMAGGEGKRLRPFTNSIPKPLLPIGRKPVAQIIVERLRDCGITTLTMSLEYAADLVRAYFQDGRQFGVTISYFQEPRKMGTAGCMAHIAELREGPFLVTNGDILTDLDYLGLLESHIKSGALLTVATRREQIAIPYGVLQLSDGRITGVEEKPKFDYTLNAGVYAVSPAALDLIPKDRAFDMTDLVNGVIASGGVVKAREIEGLWFDLAHIEDFEKAAARLQQTNPELLL